jgi:hypothetical protein
MTTEESPGFSPDQVADVTIDPGKYVDMLLRVPAMPLAESLLYAAQYKLFRRLAANDGTSYSEDDIVNALEVEYAGEDLLEKKGADNTFLTTLTPEKDKLYTRAEVWRELKKGKARKDQSLWSPKEIVDVRLQILEEHIFASLAINTEKKRTPRHRSSTRSRTRRNFFLAHRSSKCADATRSIAATSPPVRRSPWRHGLASRKANACGFAVKASRPMDQRTSKSFFPRHGR